MVVSRLLSGPVRLLWGEDVFISYARMDGTDYANNLATRLTRMGFACRIDQWDTSAGKELPPALRRALMRCRMLVLVATPHAGVSKHVCSEVEWFRGISGNIVPIDLGGYTPKAIWYGQIDGFAPVKETVAARDSARPSLAILRRITGSAHFVRRSRRLQYSAIGALTTLVLSVAAAAWFLNAAQHAVETADSAKAEAERQQTIANQAVEDAKQQTTRAENAQRKADSIDINTHVMEQRSLGTESARRRAAQSIVAYRNFPQPQSARLLAEATTSANHFLSRFSNPDEQPVVSRNGNFVAGWNQKLEQLTVYRLAKSLEPICRWTRPKEVAGGSLRALAVSNDGRHVGINLSGNGTFIFYVLAGNGTASAVGAGRLAFEDVPRNDRTLAFDDLSFSSDGRYLTGRQAMLFGDRVVPDPLVYDTAEPTRALAKHRAGTAWIQDIEVSEDSQYLAVLVNPFSTSEKQKTVVVYSLPELKLVNSFLVPLAESYLAFTPDQKILLGKDAGLGPPGPYSLVDDWRTRHPALVEVPAPTTEHLTNQHFLFFSDARTVAVFSALAINSAPTLGNEQAYATVLTNYNTAPEVVGRIANNNIQLGWGTNRGDFTSAGVTLNGDRLVTTDVSGMVTVWETRARFGTAHVRFEGELTSLSVSPTHDRIYISNRLVLNGSRTTQIYAVDDWQEVEPQVTKLEESKTENPAALSADGQWWASVVTKMGAPTRQTVELHALKGQEVRTLNVQRRQVLEPEQFNALAFSPDGTALVGLAKSGWAFVWDLTSKSPDASAFMTNEYHKEARVLAFSRDGERLVIGCGSNLSVWKDWKMQHPKRLSTKRVSDGEGETANVVAVSVGAGNAFLAAGSADGTIGVWQGWWGKDGLGQPKVFNTPVNPSFNRREELLDIAFNPQNANILSVLDRRNARVINVQTGEVNFEMPRLSGSGTASLHFSRDGRYLIASASSKHDYVFWLWSPEDLIEDACSSFLFSERLFDAERKACEMTTQSPNVGAATVQ